MSSYSVELTLQRCDRCGALPRWRVVTRAGVLRFCGHHYRQHELVLHSHNYKITEVPVA
jgi:hypothetical protein